jgi:hypothetical protein
MWLTENEDVEFTDSEDQLYIVNGINQLISRICENLNNTRGI